MAKRVLIAEDDEAIAKLVQLSIRKGGHEATVAHDGREALHFLATETFDFVVLDLLMPYYDGSEVLKSIRTTPATRELPVVILATCPPTEADELIAAYAYDPTKFLRKPFDQAELLGIIANA